MSGSHFSMIFYSLKLKPLIGRDKPKRPNSRLGLLVDISENRWLNNLNLCTNCAIYFTPYICSWIQGPKL